MVFSLLAIIICFILFDAHQSTRSSHDFRTLEYLLTGHIRSTVTLSFRKII